MNCLECRELLHKRLDGEPIVSEPIEQHLSECAVCREQHAGAMLLLDGLKKLSNPKAPAHFAQAMVAEVLRDRRQRQVRIRRRIFATMALAASVLVMLMLAFYWLPRPGTNDPGQKEKVVKRELPPPKVEPKAPPRKDEPPNVLPQRWAGTINDHAKVVLAAANVDNLPPMPMEAPASVREAGQDVSVGVEAVTRNTRKAFDFFARELPMPDMSEQRN